MRVWRSVSLLVAVTAAMPAVAADADAGGAADIVVTGQRALDGGQVTETGRVGILGDQDALDTPFSVQSFSEAFLRNTQPISVAEVLARDASVFNSGSSTRASSWYDGFFIRGYNTNSRDAGSFNGLFGLPSGSASLTGVARVDFIKGPTAFLTGAPSAVGGTFNFAPARAPDDGIASVGATYLSDSVFGGTADLGARFLGGALGVRASGSYRAGDLAVGDGELERYTAALAVDWRRGAFSAAIDLVHDYSRTSGYNYHVTLGPTYPVASGLIGAPDGRLGTQPGWMTYINDNTIVAGRAEWAFAPGWSATAAYGKSWYRNSYDSYCTVVLLDRAGNGRCDVFGNSGSAPTQSLDVGVRGAFATGPVRHQLVIGGNRISAGADYSTTVVLNPDDPSGSFFYNLFDKVRPPFPGFPPFPERVPYNRVVTEGLFAGDTLSLPDDVVTVTAGARWVRIAASNFGYGTGEFLERIVGDKLTPAIAATVQPTGWLTFYGNYVQALEPGAIAPADTANAGEVFPPLVTDQVEFGAKAEIGGVRLTAAAFRIDRGSSTRDNSTVPATFTQSGRQVHRGLELGAAGAPARGVRIVASATWLDPVLRDPGDPTRDGNRPAGVPKFAARATAEWDVPVVAGLTLTGGVAHSGKAAYDDQGSFLVDGWTSWEAGARYAFRVGRTNMVARLLIDNVTDANYWVASYSSYLAVSPPRTASLSLTADF